MGNCTSKKSRKSLKLSAKSLFQKQMDKDHDTYAKGLSKKIVPFTKGEITSFGYKKKFSSQLPVPITLTSNGHSFHETGEKPLQNGVASHKGISDEYQSGSSVESLCHAPYRLTPKMVRKRDLAKQNVPGPLDEPEVDSKIVRPTLSAVPVPLSLRNGSSNGSKTNSDTGVNRFGFRQPTPPTATNNIGKNKKKTNAISRTALLTNQDTCETGPNIASKRTEVSTRSRSEGAREAFFKEALQPANSVQSGLNQSKASLAGNIQPGKFTFQTSHLPRPQFPQSVRMSDSKTAKTAANNHRKGGARRYCNSLRDGVTNEDSGFESHPGTNNNLEKHIEILESSPGSKVRRYLPTSRGKKLEIKIVGNKFELLKNDEERSPDVVTEISLIKLPPSNIKSNPAIINTGLVEQRTSQYLKKISQPFSKQEADMGVKDLTKVLPKSKTGIKVDINNQDEGLGAESEEEKLFKDSKKSEKSSVKYLISEGCGDGEDLLPGETMAEDVSLCLSFEEELSSGCTKKISETSAFMPEIDVTPNTIRLDALKLSKQLKCKGGVFGTNPMGEDSTRLLPAGEKEEDTFPSDSILEQLSDSDSLGDKGENKHNDKEKNLKVVNLSLEKEDLGIEMDEEENSKGSTDVDENELEMNLDETEIKDDNKNCLGTNSPDSPGTPTHASNSLSLSDGRDFLIDDEIADQPQLCMSESYVDCSYKEEVKASNDKTMTEKELLTCCDVQTNTVEEDENKLLENINENGNETEVIERTKGRGRQRLNSEGTLSPCESITSDDLMLDFEMNSLEETGKSPGGDHSKKAKEVNNICSTPASPKSLDMISRVVDSPYRSSRSTPVDEESIKLDKISHQNMFQDIVGIKAMLLKLKRLLLESEGGLQENGRIYPESEILDNVMEDELTDLRRQVLFLQQQLEEREKMVEVLRLKISQTIQPIAVSPAGNDSRKRSNAATQTGLDQFQQDFPHFRIFQSTPVV